MIETESKDDQKKQYQQCKNDLLLDRNNEGVIKETPNDVTKTKTENKETPNDVTGTE